LIGLGVLAALLPRWSFGKDQQDRPESKRIVYLVSSGFPDESVICLTSNIAACEHASVVLIDSAKLTQQLKQFLSDFHPDRVVAVGTFKERLADLEQRLEVKISRLVPWTRGPPLELWKELFPSAESMVLCPPEPRHQLLQAACLAGALRAPLWLTTGNAEENVLLRRQLVEWNTRQVYAVGDAAQLVAKLELAKEEVFAKRIRLRDADAVAQAHRRILRQQGLIENLVVANPADGKRGLTNLSPLAPWVAIQRRAALLLTKENGDDAGDTIQQGLRTRDLSHAESLFLVGDLSALPMERRPNPVVGKDAYIEMEPMTPAGNEPFTLATGRLFADDPSLIPLLLARQKLLAGRGNTSKALVVSNPSGGLPLLETFSRNTTQELLNTGYQTTALFGREVNPDGLRELLPQQDIFLWEGHYATLMKEYKMNEWTEPMRPALVFLQSCLALSDDKAQSFFHRGAVSVLGTSTRTYSASGGACALAFFNALLYDHQTVGGSLRSAKNFLLAYSLLKEKRLGKSAKLSGANLRSAWAFSLWGDPTLKLPPPLAPEESLPAVHHVVHGRAIIVTLPGASHQKAISSKYRAQMPPNGRLAGLITPDEDDEDIKHLIPFLFVEVHLPKVPEGKEPRLHSKLPETRWVFCWDARRKCGQLLFMPRAKDRDELRFYVDWNEESAASFLSLESRSSSHGPKGSKGPTHATATDYRQRTTDN
jgi:hypothetical protein